MIPCIQDRGHSFIGVTAYLMHDRGAKTGERVAWTETGNLRTNDPEKAAKVMAWTDKHRDEIRAGYRAENDMKPSAAGRKASAGNVLHHSLSWALGERPTEKHQRETVKAYLKHQGLDTHQYYVVGHSDTDHVHVHIVTNLVNPETGKIHELSFAKRNAQKWALGYERKYGLHCHAREENAAKHAQGETTKYRDQKQDYATRVTRAYHASDSGKAFVQSLKEEGLSLCMTRRGSGFVIVDERGDIQKLVRQLDIDEKGKAKTAAINKKLGDLDRAKLADADKLATERKARRKAAQQARSVTQHEKPAPPPVYKTIDHDRERVQDYAKRLAEIDKIRAYYNLGKHRSDLEKANKALAAKQGFFARLFGQTRRAEEHTQAMRLNLEDAQKKQQQAIDAINEKYHIHPETRRSGVQRKDTRLTKEAKQQATNGNQPQSRMLPELGKMREGKDIQDAVKKQGWQEPEGDPFSGLKPKFQEGAREAYRAAKADEIKRNEEQKGLGKTRRSRLDHD